MLGEGWEDESSSRKTPSRLINPFKHPRTLAFTPATQADLGARRRRLNCEHYKLLEPIVGRSGIPAPPVLVHLAHGCLYHDVNLTRFNSLQVFQLIQPAEAAMMMPIAKSSNPPKKTAAGAAWIQKPANVTRVRQCQFARKSSHRVLWPSLI